MESISGAVAGVQATLDEWNEDGVPMPEFEGPPDDGPGDGPSAGPFSMITFDINHALSNQNATLTLPKGLSGYGFAIWDILT